MRIWTSTSGSQARATAAAAASLVLIAPVIPLAPVGADPLALGPLETDGMKTEKPAEKMKWFRTKEKPSEKDVGNE